MHDIPPVYRYLPDGEAQRTCTVSASMQTWTSLPPAIGSVLSVNLSSVIPRALLARYAHPDPAALLDEGVSRLLQRIEPTGEDGFVQIPSVVQHRIGPQGFHHDLT